MRKRKRSVIVKELDKVFSQYIRQKYANLDGFVDCFTCGRSYHWKKIQNGHFMTRARYSTRWDEENCRPQCYGCNVGQGGRQYIFAQNLDKEAPGKADAMHVASLQTVKFMDYELEELITEYKQKITEI